MSSSKPYWKRGKESAKGGGGGKSEDLEDRRFQLSKEPYFNNVTPVDMENYLDRCHLYALTNHPQIAPWIKGKIPHVMLEFPQAREKKNLLGLLAKYHIPKDGSIQETNLTANEVRLNLIADTITEDELEANEGHSEDEEWEYIEVLEKDAIKSLFPTVDSKARVATRSHLEREAQSLMGKMLFAWPSKDIQTKMTNHAQLMKAYDTVDLIAFVEELRAFSVAGSGNPEANKEDAELRLTNLKMKGNRVLEYVKDFTTAVQDVQLCKSSFTELKIVDLFFRNLCQVLFPQWYTNFLTADHSLYRFKTLPFQDAKEHVINYFNCVIRATINLNKQESKPNNKPNNNNNNNNNVDTPQQINTVKGVKALVAGNVPGYTPISHTVLATILSGKRQIDQSATGKPDKKTKVKFEEKQPHKDETKKKIHICFDWRDKGTCKYGDKCYFIHQKA